MANKWKEKRIGELGRIVTGKTPSTLNPNYFGHDICFITPRDMNGNKKINKTERNLSNEGALVVKNCILPPCSICVSCIGSDMGKVVMTTKESVTNQQLNSIICDKNHDPNFVYYAITNLSDDLRNIAFHSTAVPILNKKDFSSFSIMCPAIENQHAIAHILATLDDKIELLRQMNETLEAIARALFKSWFIDFDPVRKKAEGQPTGLPPEIDALFPDSFEDSELGEIPRGWKIKELSEEFDITMGQSPPGESYNETGVGVPFYQGRTDFGFRFPTHRLFCTDPKRFAENGDTLVSVRAPVGDMNMANEKCCIGRGVASVRHKEHYRSFTYYCLNSLRESFYSFEAEGTVFGSINQKDFNKIKCVIATPELIRSFDNMICPIDNAIYSHSVESSLLGQQRDSLLPKLISGDLELSDKMISKIVEPVK